MINLTGFCCPVCGGNMYEELYEPIACCDTCGFVVRADGSLDLSWMDMENLELDETILEFLSGH